MRSSPHGSRQNTSWHRNVEASTAPSVGTVDVKVIKCYFMLHLLLTLTSQSHRNSEEDCEVFHRNVIFGYQNQDRMFPMLLLVFLLAMDCSQVLGSFFSKNPSQRPTQHVHFAKYPQPQRPKNSPKVGLSNDTVVSCAKTSQQGSFNLKHIQGDIYSFVDQVTHSTEIKPSICANTH